MAIIQMRDGSDLDNGGTNGKVLRKSGCEALWKSRMQVFGFEQLEG